MKILSQLLAGDGGEVGIAQSAPAGGGTRDGQRLRLRSGQAGMAVPQEIGENFRERPGSARPLQNHLV